MFYHQRIARCALAVVGICCAFLPPPVTAETSQGSSAAVGAPCIALMAPAIKGIPGHADDIGNAVRDLFAKYLTAPTFKTVILEARLPALAMSEARDKGCTNVLTITMTGKQSGGSRLGRLAGQAAGTAAVYVPGSSNAGTAIARGAAVGTAHAVSSLASSTKVKDELKLEYTLQTTDNAVRLGPATQRAKAEVNGEDILTPVVERAATQIADLFLKSPR